MTTDESRNDESIDMNAALPKLEQNMERIQVLTQRLLGAMSNKRKVPQDLQGPAPELYAKAGKVLFDGPYETEQDKAAVPEEMRERLDRLDIDKRGNGMKLRILPMGGGIPPADVPEEDPAQ